MLGGGGERGLLILDCDVLSSRLRSDGSTAGAAHSSEAPLESQASDSDELIPRLRPDGRTAGSAHSSEAPLLSVESPPTALLLM